jgi:chitodextrinase
MTRSSEHILSGLLPLCFVIACQGETTTPTSIPVAPGKIAALVVDDVVATVTLVPDSQMVFAGDRFKIIAKPKNAAGQVLTRKVRWTVGTPTVAKALDSLKATMTFKALRAGTTSIRATVDGKSRSGKVVVRSTTGAKVVVTPAEATVATGGTMRFGATGLTQAGETAAVNVTWTTTGGTISSIGVLKAGSTPGTYRVTATSRFGAADSSPITITATPASVTAVILVPATASLAPGDAMRFSAYGRTGAGDSVAVAVSYTGTGGTISGGGLYTAGSAAGTYRVIARNAAGVADTAQVMITPPQVARVTLLPDIAASRAGATTQFVASVYNSLGNTVPEPVTYEATCGTVSGSGVFTAPLNGSGDCLVIATAKEKTDTTKVQLLPNSRSHGVPFGPFSLWANPTTTQASGAAPFSASHDYIAPSSLVSHIEAARSKGVRLLLAMTGGSHERYKTNGVFDLGKWQAVMDAFNTPGIRNAIADGVADGTIIGNSVMDEPQQSGNDGSSTKSWGPAGTMTKARVDGLCSYVKTLFPTLPTGVFHDPKAFEPDISYRVCEFMAGQYRLQKGSVTTWRDAGLAIAARDGMQIAFSLNILDGGKQDRDGVWDCSGTGGLGTYAPNCSMTAAEIREWGKVLGQAGCALLAWRYSAAFVGKPENQAAFSEVALTLSDMPRTQCSRETPNLPPVAGFASDCGALTCNFTDESRDEDGTVETWTWNFGDGTGSTSRHPSHTYSDEGTYQVALTVTDDHEAGGSVVQSVTVTAPPPENNAPVAAFTSSCNDLICSFTDESNDQDGTVASWIWDFGDGTSSSSRHPNHTYEAEGSYEVTLLVTDDDAATGTVIQTVTVIAPPAGP